MTGRKFASFFLQVVLGLSLAFLSGCFGSDGGFDELSSGNVDNIDELTLDSVSPDVESLVLEIGQTQTFFVSARAPTGRLLTYNWNLDGAFTGQVGASYSLVASSGNIGSRIVEARISDGIVTKTRSWTVKVNGPPTLTKVTEGTPKVSVGSQLTISTTGADPNGDTLSYTWLLNGVASAHLVGSGSSAVLTGHDSIVGQVNISATVSDGTASAQVTWVAEINHFPNECNALATGNICTYAGSPSVGDGLNPLDPGELELKISPIAQAQDSLGNLYLADWQSNIVWYWNKTANPITRHTVLVPANTIKVIAGTGETGTGPDGVALQSALNGPRGLYYDNTSQRLFIAEWGSNRVRYVDSSGFISTGMGGGASHVNGASAFTHSCANPVGLAFWNDNLYVACRESHRVKRWDLTTDLAYTVYGNGANNFNNVPGLATGGTIQGGRPNSLFIDADGVYISHRENHRITFINHSGSAKTFWADTSLLTVPNGHVAIIAGTGANGSSNDSVPTAGQIGQPTGIVVKSNLIYFTKLEGNADHLWVANNSGSDYTLSGVTVQSGRMRIFSNTGGAGYNGSGLNISASRINDTYWLSEDVLNPNKLIFSDFTNNLLREFNLTTGKLDDLAGSTKRRFGFFGDTSKPTLQHLFERVTGVVFDSVNRILFFADSINCRIRAADPYGNIETALARGCNDPTIDNDVPSNSYLRINWTNNDNWMAGLNLLPNGSLLVANGNSNNIRMWNRSTTSDTFYGTYIQSDRVSNIAGDYLTSGNGADGDATSVAMNNPMGVVYNSQDQKIYIADSYNHCIRALDSSGNLAEVLGNCGTSGNSIGASVAAASLEMNTPSGIAVDSLGNLVIADRANHKIRYWNRTASAVTFGLISVPAGHVGTIACVNGGAGSHSESILATSSICSSPTGVAINDDYVCYSNYGLHNVRCIYRTGANAGRVETMAGYPSASARAGSPVGFEQEGILGRNATLNSPTDLSFDSNGDLYIADMLNHVVRKLKLSQ